MSEKELRGKNEGIRKSRENADGEEGWVRKLDK